MANNKLTKKINHYITKIAHGNIFALEKLFEITKKPFLIVAQSYLTDKSKAEDVLSEAYLKVVKSAASFDKKQNGYNWLYEIVKNTALNQNKKDSYRRYEVLNDNYISDYDCIDNLLDKILVNNAIQTLTLIEKRIIYLYFFERKTIREIALLLNKSPTSTFELLHKTLDKIKKNLINNPKNNK